MKRTTWRCPNCQYNVIAEVAENCEVRTRISGLDDNNQLEFENIQDSQSGRVVGYECSHCKTPVMKGKKKIVNRNQLIGLLLSLVNKFDIEESQNEEPD